jgi:cytidine deaminase
MVLANPVDHKIRLIAILSPNVAPCFPCGACRQVLHEFSCEEPIVLEASDTLRRYPFGTFPYAFGSKSL